MGRDKVELFTLIRWDHKQGFGIRALAEKYQVHRRTVRQALDLPRAFRTADLRLIHAAICCSRYSLWTCCGVRY